MNLHFSDMFSFECLWVLYNSKNKKILTDICFFIILSNVLVPYSILVKCLSCSSNSETGTDFKIAFKGDDFLSV